MLLQGGWRAHQSGIYAQGRSIEPVTFSADFPGNFSWTGLQDQSSAVVGLLEDPSLRGEKPPALNLAGAAKRTPHLGSPAPEPHAPPGCHQACPSSQEPPSPPPKGAMRTLTASNHKLALAVVLIAHSLAPSHCERQRCRQCTSQH